MAHMPKDVRAMNINTFELIVSIDDKGSDQIEQAVRLLGALPHNHVQWHIDDPWGDDPTAYERSALPIVRALAQLRSEIQERPAQTPD